MVFLALPLAGAFLLSPLLAAVALPQLLVNALSDWDATTDPRHHYIAGVLPFLVAATILGIARLPARRRTQAAVAILMLSSFFTVAVGPWSGTPAAKSGRFHATLPRTHVEALRAAVALVPDDAAVTATNAAGSQLSARRHFYSVPVLPSARRVDPARHVEHLDAAVGIPYRRPAPELLRAFLDRIQASPRWRQIFERDGVFVFRRAAR